MPDALIPALESAGLDLVPGYRLDPETGQEDLRWRAEHFAWYERVRDWRAWAQGKFKNDSAFRQDLLLLCSRDSSLFALTFLDIEEPRSMSYFDQTGIGLTEALEGLKDPSYEVGVEDLSYRTIHPFIPFSYQVEAHRTLTYVILGPLRGFYFDVLWDKARGIGMSYAFLAWAYWAWLFVPGLRGTILTEKWDKAERSKDINSLFGKLDLFLDSTPDAIIPEGFRGKGQKDASRLNGALINPVTGAALFTEPTTADSTRGGREAFVGVDELNFHEYLDETWATIAGTTKHRIGWSSANYRYGRQGERKFVEGKKHPTACRVFTLDWFENPHQDQAWFISERERFRAAGQEEQFEVEYLRNAAAGSGRLVYKKQLVLVPWTDDWYDGARPLCLSVDPSSGGDATAFVFWQTRAVDDKKVIRFIDATKLDKVPVQFWAHVITGIPPRGATDGEPPDEMYAYWLEGYFDVSNIRHIMEWLRHVSPHSMRLYGDPAMRSRDTTHGSWIDNFWPLTLSLRQREFGADHPNAIPTNVNLPWEILTRRNNFTDRRIGLREALTYAEFTRGVSGVAELYEALNNTMFQEVTERSTRGPGHLHDLGSDLTSAAEFGMIWETLHLTEEELQVEPLRKIEQPRVARKSRPASSPHQRRTRANRLDSLAGIY
jgi:hypothetical protein